MPLRIRSKGLWKLVLAAVLVLLPAAAATGAQPLNVVTTFSVLSDLAEQVGGDFVEVTSIVPLGGDPHTWEPTPREARNVAAADVLLYNGLGLEVWVDRLIANAARPDLPIIVLSEGLEPLPGAAFAAHSHEAGDPHFWLNVRHAMVYVERIRDAFIQLDPENSAVYERQAEEYLQELVELDLWLEEVVLSIPEENRKLITYHDAFGYMADRYGLEIVGFLVVNPDREPSSREMVQLTQELSQLPRRVIFVEPQISGGLRYAQAIADEIGGKIGMLYSDSLTQDVPTYVDMMRFNGEQLREALQ